MNSYYLLGRVRNFIKGSGIMTIREQTEKIEHLIFSKHAQLSDKTLGRRKAEEKCNIRTEFQRDRDRIIHSKAFRRLKHKTQVFINPEDDHYRTRLTHTLEVSQIARTIARSLRLNEDLAEAIALGHDLGHTPFGHTGEEVLNKLSVYGFKHNEQSLRVVDILENGKGLNLTQEVRDGILNHTGKNKPFTLEGQIIRFADRIAYINHDIDDAIRASILSQEDIPNIYINILGKTHSNRINTMIADIITASFDKNKINMSTKIYEATMGLREFMFKNVYIESKAKEPEGKAQEIVIKLYDFFTNNPAQLPKHAERQLKNTEKHRVISDYIAGMTDDFAINIFNNIFSKTNNRDIKMNKKDEYGYN